MTMLPPATVRSRVRPATQPETRQPSSPPLPSSYARVWMKRPSPLWCRSPASRSSSGPRWRADLAESVFLGTAVLRLGLHLFGDDWADADMRRTYIAPEAVGETCAEDKAVAAWKRIHFVFDTIARTAEAGQLELRVDIGARSLLWLEMRRSTDQLAICPRHWFAQPHLEHLFYDCRINPIEPDRELESHHALRHEVFVDRAGLERMMENHFWSDSARAQWPTGDAGHVFFGEALLRVGRTKFGDKWRDDAPAQPFPFSSPALPDPLMEATDRFLATRQYARDVAGDWTRQALTEVMDAARDGRLRLYTSEHLRRSYDLCPATWWVEGDWQHLLKGGTLNVSAPQSAARPPASSRLLFADAGDLRRLWGAEDGSAEQAGPLSPSEDGTPDSQTLDSADADSGGSVRWTVLALYRERLTNRKALRRQYQEAAAISDAWRGPVRQPTDRRIGEHLSGLHNKLRFPAGRLDALSADLVISEIGKIIGNFELPTSDTTSPT